MGLSVLSMADGLVTLVDEVNLKGASLLVRKVFGLGAEGAGGRIGDLLHQTGYSRQCLHLSGFWQSLKLCDTYLTSCQLRPGGNLCGKPVAERLEWPRSLQISQAVWHKMSMSYPGAEGEPCFGIKWQHMTFDCPPHVV